MKVKPVTLDAHSLIMGLDTGASEKVNDNGVVGKAVLLTDSLHSVNIDALVPVKEAFNWRHWILWAVLIEAVLMLIWMVVTLLKKMSNESE